MAPTRPESLIAIAEISEVKIDHIKLLSLEKPELNSCAAMWSLSEALKVLRDKTQNAYCVGCRFLRAILIPATMILCSQACNRPCSIFRCQHYHSRLFIGIQKDSIYTSKTGWNQNSPKMEKITRNSTHLQIFQAIVGIDSDLLGHDRCAAIDLLYYIVDE